MMIKAFVFVPCFLMAVLPVARAQDAAAPVSQCQAVARTMPGATFANMSADLRNLVLPVQANRSLELDEKVMVDITYIGHSTYFIETPGGVGIATDYSGVYRPSRLPDVVTMNKAHSSHYTLYPDEGIGQVLHGWSDVPGEKASHDLVVGDAYIRNVTTDIRSWEGGFEENSNSIFIFEVAGLCIGHLGHLHHELTENHYTEIGRLDVVMVPVDGGLTMGAESMTQVVSRLRSSVILPMHQPSGLDSFLAMISGRFSVRYAGDATITVSV